MSDYSDELIRNAIVNYINGRESNRQYASKYYSIKKSMLENYSSILLIGIASNLLDLQIGH